MRYINGNITLSKKEIMGGMGNKLIFFFFAVGFSDLSLRVPVLYISALQMVQFSLKEIFGKRRQKYITQKIKIPENMAR
jgi:hypothetical protein